MESRYLTLNEAAKYLPHGSRGYLNVLVRRRQLRAEKIGASWYTKKEWVDEYLRARPRLINKLQSSEPDDTGAPSPDSLRRHAEAERLARLEREITELKRLFQDGGATGRVDQNRLSSVASLLRRHHPLRADASSVGRFRLPSSSAAPHRAAASSVGRRSSSSAARSPRWGSPDKTSSVLPELRAAAASVPSGRGPRTKIKDRALHRQALPAQGSLKRFAAVFVVAAISATTAQAYGPQIQHTVSDAVLSFANDAGKLERRVDLIGTKGLAYASSMLKNGHDLLSESLEDAQRSFKGVEDIFDRKLDRIIESAITFDQRLRLFAGRLSNELLAFAGRFDLQSPITIDTSTPQRKSSIESSATDHFGSSRVSTAVPPLSNSRPSASGTPQRTKGSAGVGQVPAGAAVPEAVPPSVGAYAPATSGELPKDSASVPWESAADLAVIRSALTVTEAELKATQRNFTLVRSDLGTITADIQALADELTALKAQTLAAPASPAIREVIRESV
ncbi:MAG: helix-turn-helix domain-containing protein, partial [bacterium]|nr:helix-turn-helix domain-containing protein [bacterium]